MKTALSQDSRTEDTTSDWLIANLGTVIWAIRLIVRANDDVEPFTAHPYQASVGKGGFTCIVLIIRFHAYQILTQLITITSQCILNSVTTLSNHLLEKLREVIHISGSKRLRRKPFQLKGDH